MLSKTFFELDFHFCKSLGGGGVSLNLKGFWCYAIFLGFVWSFLSYTFCVVLLWILCFFFFFFFCLLLEFNQVCNVLIVGLALVPQCLGQTQRHLRSQRI